ncbi:hypothetical protein EW146_g4214 [Bondarzewia mesenterica]|uniref:Uncharacterized protein n=1 Tax=Bondarzewia mesenterica TaxID=1095465 RepID=A0A4S4LVE5_9AGAM|nr:hypothetical protein EW146_g4214 [Bondarzewia mesenterica]
MLKLEWQRNQQKAAGAIILSVDESCRGVLDGLEDDPIAMWAKLESTFNEKWGESLCNTLKDLFSIRKKEDESLQSLMYRIDEAMRILKNLCPVDYDLKTQDEELVCFCGIVWCSWSMNGHTEDRCFKLINQQLQGKHSQANAVQEFPKLDPGIVQFTGSASLYTGATSHMTPHRHWLCNYKPHVIPVHLADSTVIYSAGIGSVVFVPLVGGKEAQAVEFSSILHVPAICHNLLSVLYLTRQKKFSVVIEGSMMHFMRDNSVCTQHLMRENMVIGLQLDSDAKPDPICKPCLAGKMHANPFPSIDSHFSNPLELVHSDLHGPLPVSSHSGMQYFISVIDDGTSWKVVYTLHLKSGQIAPSLKPLLPCFTSGVCLCLSEEKLWHLLSMSAWHGATLNGSHLRVWGCTAYVHVQKDKRGGLGSHMEKCVFIEYPDGYKGWKFYLPASPLARSVSFLDSLDAEGDPLPVLAGDGDTHDDASSSLDEPVVSDGEKLVEEALMAEVERALFVASPGKAEPSSYRQTLNCSDADEWQKAAQGKWMRMLRMALERSFHCLLVTKRSVLAGLSRSNEIQMARWRATRLALLLKASVSVLDFHLHSIDISHTFINEELDIEIYMEQPEGFDKHPGCAKIILPVFVDDCTFVSNSVEILDKIVAELASTFCLRDLGPSTSLLGIEIIRDRPNHRLSLRQYQYIIDMLQHYSFDDSSPVKVPILPGVRLCSDMSAKFDEEDKEYMKTVPYISGVGSLLFLAMSTRPDIAHAVSTLCRFNFWPGIAHWKAVKHLFRYLQGTLDYKLTYGPFNSP